MRRSRRQRGASLNTSGLWAASFLRWNASTPSSLVKNTSPFFSTWLAVFPVLILLACFTGFYPEADAQVQKTIASAHALPESSGAAAGALPSAASRLQHFSQEFNALKDAARGILENLWPDTPLPTTLGELSSRLDGAPAEIDEQVEMAARGGSDMALALVKSWYPRVQVGMQAGGFRTGTSLEGLRPEICVASERIAKIGRASCRERVYVLV